MPPQQQGLPDYGPRSTQRQENSLHKHRQRPSDGKAVIELTAKARYRFGMKQSDIILADPESLGGTPVSTGTRDHDQHL
jgi:hypothetical protein